MAGRRAGNETGSGQKTDVKDCQWIQQLHSYGLLKRCYVSDGLIKELRSYQRLREDHLRSASMHVQHMQKALIEMNIRLPDRIAVIKAIRFYHESGLIPPAAGYSFRSMLLHMLAHALTHSANDLPANAGNCEVLNQSVRNITTFQ